MTRAREAGYAAIDSRIAEAFHALAGVDWDNLAYGYVVLIKSDGTAVVRTHATFEKLSEYLIRVVVGGGNPARIMESFLELKQEEGHGAITVGYEEESGTVMVMSIKRPPQ